MIQIELCKDEAIVLFEWLAELSDKDLPELEGTAEERVLCRLEGRLIKHIDSVISPRYRDELEQARRRILES